MGSVRVTGGRLRGRNVPLPPYDLRPTSGRAREAYFNVVAPRIDGASFLDLFCGTGIFSVEAASRGAARITAVDQSKRSLELLSRLAREWNLPVTTMLSDALIAVRRLAAEPREFDLVYADPPYDWEHHAALVAEIDAKLPLAEEALVAVEHRAGRHGFEPPPLGRLAMTKTARYGNVAITWFRRER
ncbi:MAG TPA: RsmD family RNA methyltransferase [Thermoanaerobaculia bacterium]